MLLLATLFVPFFLVYTHRLLTDIEVVHHVLSSSTQPEWRHKHPSSRLSPKVPIRTFVPPNLTIARSSSTFQWKDGCMQPVSIRNAPQSSPSKTPPTGIVVVLATGTDDVPQVQQDNFRRICKVIPTQVEYLLESQGLDMLLLVEESPGWTAQSIISCLRLEPIHGNATTSQTWTNLDGTKLTAKPYHLNPQSLSRQSVQHMSTIYVAAIKTELPQYIQKDPSILKKPITPKSCDAPRRYIQATRWYTREMLHLGILQHYDYVLKVDTDILFVDTIPFHLLEDMKRKGAIMGHTAQYHPRGSQTCAKGIHNAVVNFTASVHATTTSWKQSICSASSPELQWDVDWYYTNFVLFDTRFWQSPWILEFANFLSEYLNGFFSYRWTDQIFWHQAMGLFLSNYTDYVVDYTNLRCMPSPNCWRSSYDFKKYGHDAWHRCDNGGYFLHPKDYRISPTSQIKKTRPLGRLLWNDTSYQQELFESTYQMKCS